MTRFLIALLAVATPALAEGTINSNAEIGNLAFTKPYLISVTYARSSDNDAAYALAITAKDQIKDQNGLEMSTALFVNCKTGGIAAAYGFDVDQPIETAQTIALSFCVFHKQQFSHSLW